MAKVIGTVKEVLDGKFYAKSQDGTVRELHAGDEIYMNEIVYGDSSNPKDSKIIIDLIGDDKMLVVSGDNSQLFDVTLAQEDLSEDETVTKQETMEVARNEYLDTADNNADDLETEAGEDIVQSTGVDVDHIQDMNIRDVNIQANLRDIDPATATASAFQDSEGTDLYAANQFATPFATTSTVAATTTTTSGTESGTGSAITVDLATDSGVDGDNITKDNTPTFTGTTEPGAEVVITDEADNIVGSAVADENGAYEITTSELADGEHELTITVTDTAGNTATTSTTVTIDTVADAGEVTIDPIAGDDIINASEAGEETITVSGTATGGDIQAGDSVTVTVNGNEYTTTVADDGTYSVEVATADLLADNTVDVSVESTDVAGNTVTSGTSATVTVDTTADADSNLKVAVAADDSVVNADEAEDVSVSITGVDSDVESVEITFTDKNGESVTVDATQNEDGSWSVPDADISDLADGNVTVSATVTDAAGNTNMTEVTTITKDTVAGDLVDENGNPVEMSAPVVTIVDDINDDQTLNSSEKDDELDYVVSIPEGAKAGDTLSVQINDEVSEITITEDMIQSGEYTGTTTVPAEGETVVIKASITDSDGNTTSSTEDSVTVDTTFGDEGDVILGELAVTDIVDNSGDYASVTMHGTGVIAGDTVQLFVNPGTNASDENYDFTQTPAHDSNGNIITAVVQEDGTWSFDISDVQETPENDNEFFTVAEFDKDGNVISTSEVHYWHGTAESANVEAADDFVLTGSGDDVIRDSVDDNNDRLVIDGGDGNDTVIFNGSVDEYTIEENENGEIVVTHNASTDSDADGVGDVHVLRNIENVRFSDANYNVSTGTLNHSPVMKTVESTSQIAGSEDSPVVIDVLSNINDVDNDTLSITKIAGQDIANGEEAVIKDEEGNVLGSARVVNGQIEFTPSEALQQELNAGESRGVAFTYTVSDGNGAEVSGTVNVNVIGNSDLGELAITDIVDNKGDYSSVTMHGTSIHAGDTVQLYINPGENDSDEAYNNELRIAHDKEGNPITAVVKEDGTWSFDISNIQETPENDNEFFVVKEFKNGEEIAQTGPVHFWHGTWENAQTESADDFILAGDKNDKIHVVADDANDHLVIDGGEGKDKVEFDDKFENYTLSRDEDGNTTVTHLMEGEDGELIAGDVVELRNIEEIKFEDASIKEEEGEMHLVRGEDSIDLSNIEKLVESGAVKEIEVEKGGYKLQLRLEEILQNGESDTIRIDGEKGDTLKIDKDALKPLDCKEDGDDNFDVYLYTHGNESIRLEINHDITLEHM